MSNQVVYRMSTIFYLKPDEGRLNVRPMKNKNFGGYGIRITTTLAAGIGLLQLAAVAGDLTALELFKKGDQLVGSEAEGRLVQIRSEKSIASLTPSIWYVTYYDPNSSGKATEIKFEAGAKTEMNYKGNFLGIGKKPKELPKDRIKVDSDAAIRTATGEPLLKNLTLKATQLILEEWQGIPTWKVEIWAAKLQKPERMVDVGEVYVSAEDGKVLRSDLKISKVD